MRETGDQIVDRSKTVTVTLTRKQANTLWWLLEGEMGRDDFQRRTMRTLSQIGKRVSDAIGVKWHW